MRSYLKNTENHVRLNSNCSALRYNSWGAIIRGNTVLYPTCGAFNIGVYINFTHGYSPSLLLASPVISATVGCEDAACTISLPEASDPVRIVLTHTEKVYNDVLKLAVLLWFFFNA